MSGRLAQINVSNGGVPKLPVPRARVGPLGLEGDAQRDRRIHGGPLRALCLFSLEVIARLQAEGHPIVPGGAGENLTIEGIDFVALRPGSRLQIGASVLIELTSYTAPCETIAGCFRDGDFTRISPRRSVGESRMYARVLAGGEVAVGDTVQVM